MLAIAVGVLVFFFFFFNDTATTEIYTLSLHDALPIGWHGSCCQSIFTRRPAPRMASRDRKSTRLNSSHVRISYAVFCLKKKKTNHQKTTPHTCTPCLPPNHHRLPAHSSPCPPASHSRS